MILTRNVGPEDAETSWDIEFADFRDLRAKIAANPTYDRVCGLVVFLETMKSATPSLRGVSAILDLQNCPFWRTWEPKPA